MQILFLSAAANVLPSAKATISSISSYIENTVPTLLIALATLIFGVIIIKLTLKILLKAFQKGKLDKTICSFLKSFIKVTLYIILLVIVLSLLKIPTTSLVTLIGAAGIAIGLALQDSISNLAGGFLVLFSKPFVVGDYISSGSTEGVVAEISILHTKLNTIDNKAIYIPNGQVSSSVLINYTREEKRRLDLVFSISYDNDFNVAKKIISEIVESNKYSILTPEPMIRVIAQNSSSIDICCRVWVKSEDYWNLNFDLLEDVKTAFDKNNISIPYNQLDVNIKK